MLLNRAYKIAAVYEQICSRLAAFFHAQFPSSAWAKHFSLFLFLWYLYACMRFTDFRGKHRQKKIGLHYQNYIFISSFCDVLCLAMKLRAKENEMKRKRVQTNQPSKKYRYVGEKSKSKHENKKRKKERYASCCFFTKPVC